MKIREIIFCSLMILFSNQIWADDIQEQVQIQTISAQLQSKLYGPTGLKKMIAKLEVLKNSKVQCIQYRNNAIDNIDKIIQSTGKDINSPSYQTLLKDLQDKKKALIERKLNCEVTLLKVDGLIHDIQKEINNLKLDIRIHQSIWTLLSDPNVFSQGIHFVPFTDQWNLNELTSIDHYSLLFITLAGIILGYELRLLCIKYINQSKTMSIQSRFLNLTKSFILYFTPLSFFTMFIYYKTQDLKTTNTILYFFKLVMVFSVLKYLSEVYFFCILNIKYKLWKQEIQTLFLIIFWFMVANSITNWVCKKFLILTVTSAFFIKIYILATSILLMVTWCYLIHCLTHMKYISKELKIKITQVRYYLYFIVGLFYIMRTTLSWVYGLDEISLGLTREVLMVVMIVIFARILFRYLSYIDEGLQNDTILIRKIRLHKLLGINPKVKVKEITFFKHLFMMLAILVFFIPLSMDCFAFPEQLFSYYISIINNSIIIGPFAFSIVHLIEAGMIYCVLIILGKFLISKYTRHSAALDDAHKKNILLMTLTFSNQFLAIIFSLGVAGINFKELGLILGGLSIGIGIGLNTLISNIVSGLLILIKKPIRINDYISLLIPRIHVPIQGRVQKIDLLYTQILTNEENMIYLSNTLIITSAITNYTMINKSSCCFISLKFISEKVLPKAKDLCMVILLKHAKIVHNGVLAPNINDNILHHKDKPQENILDISFTVKDSVEKQDVENEINRSIEEILEQNNIQLINLQGQQITNLRDDELND